LSYPKKEEKLRELYNLEQELILARKKLNGELPLEKYKTKQGVIEETLEDIKE
jgi:hypothetical protein